MSDYGSPEPNHTAALAAVDEARQEALAAVSKRRQFGASPHHPNLAPADGGEPTLASICTQKVVDYLLQLRPYRDNSQHWDVTIGSITLPKRIEGKGSNRRSGSGSRSMWLCRQPKIPLNNVSNVIDAANQTVQYSTMRGDRDSAFSPPGGDKCRVRTDEYGELVFTDQRSAMQAMSGKMSFEQAIERGAAMRKQELEQKTTDYVPAKPVSNSSAGLKRGTSHKTKSFNVVFGDQALLELVEIGDEVAAEIDILIELDTPDYSSGGGGAV